MDSSISGQHSMHDIDGSSAQSSPDPLALSSPLLRRRGKEPSVRSTGRPLSKTSANIGCRQDIFDNSSPSKSFTMTTSSLNKASPWKIKVTVEAEPHISGQDENSIPSPTHKRVTRTRTTTVPLKGADESSPVKRRGRPRKSGTAATPRNQRNGTPVRRTRRSRGDTESRGDTTGTVETAESLEIPQHKRRPGRPRKKDPAPTEPAERRSFETAQPLEEPQEKRRPGRARKKDQIGDADKVSERQCTVGSLEPITVSASADVAKVVEPKLLSNDPGDSESVTSASSSRQGNANLDRPQEEPIQPMELDSSKPLAPINSVFDFTQLTPLHEKYILPTPKPAPPQFRPREPNSWSEGSSWGKATHPRKMRPSVDAADDVFSTSNPEDKERMLDDARRISEDKGTPPSPFNPIIEEDTAILESEGFSMVSIDSLPSMQASLSSPSSDEPLSYTTRPLDQELRLPNLRSMAPSIVPSSPPDQLRHRQTPTLQMLSPSAPPPIETPSLPHYKAPTPKLSKVVKAGIALQGVLKSPEKSGVSGSSDSDVERQQTRLDNLFRGLGENTERELRAGLRLGQKLAQRASHQNSPASAGPSNWAGQTNSEDGVFDTSTSSRYTERSRLLTPDPTDSDTASPSPKLDVPSEIEYPSLTAAIQSIQPISPGVSNDESDHQPTPSDTSRVGYDEAMQEGCGTNPILEVEQENQSPLLHQGKGEEQHTRLANRSRITASRSDAENGDGGNAEEDDGDIWQEEASRSSNLRLQGEGTSPTTSTEEVGIRPRGKTRAVRTKQPRRNSKPSVESSETDDSRTFWQHNSSATSKSSDGNTPKLDLSLLLGLKGGQSAPSLSLLGSPSVAIPSKPQTSNNALRSPIKAISSIKAVNTPAVIYSGLPRHSPAEKDDVDASIQLHREESEDRRISHCFPDTRPLKGSPLKQELTPSKFREVKASDEEVSLAGVGTSISSDVQQLYTEMLNRRTSRHSTATIGSDMVDKQGSGNDGDENREASLASVNDSVSSDVQQLRAEMLSRQRSLHHSTNIRRMILEESSAVEEISGLDQKNGEQNQIKNPRRRSTAPAAQSGLFSRLTGGIFNTLGLQYPPPPAPHPVLSIYDTLPRLEPWTRTHYKVLDSLLQQSKRNPSLFDSAIPHNKALLASTYYSPSFSTYIGLEVNSWGYSVTLAGWHLVLCAAYYQLLTLDSIYEWEEREGRSIDRGRVRPRRDGLPIDQWEVIRRFMTILIGEDIRRDEKKGKLINRTGPIVFKWPEGKQLVSDQRLDNRV